MTKKLFPDQEILSTKNFSAHQDWEVPIVGFFIIASKNTTKRSIIDFTEEEAHEFIHVAQNVRTAMNEVLGIEDVYLFQNEDSTHGFHLWIFPRHVWMEEFGRKIESVRPIMEYAKGNMNDEKTCDEVREAVTRVSEYLVGK
jgi:diadenosine tetraphosphate (Ap4A) HIT family hydrolase